MAKTSPTKLFFFFILLAYARIFKNITPISAIVDQKIPRNSSCTDAEACQKGPWKYIKAELRKVEGNCDESHMTSFTNAVTCTRNAGKIGYLAEALLHKLVLNPSFIDNCRRKGDREMMVPEDYHRGLDLLLEVFDQLGIYEERIFHAREEDENIEDDVVDRYDDLLNAEEVDQDIEVNFLD